MVKEGMPVSAIETPAVIVSMDVLESNIAEMSRLAREAGVRLRPHTKIHECPDIAKMQIAAGACGIEVGAIERALCMAEAGIDDILIAHPFYDDHKLSVLRRLLGKPGLKITVMADMPEQAEGISRVDFPRKDDPHSPQGEYRGRPVRRSSGRTVVADGKAAPPFEGSCLRGNLRTRVGWKTDP